MNTENRQDTIDEWIISYLSGEHEPEQHNELLQWVNASDKNKEYFRNMQEVWFAAVATNPHTRFDKGTAYTRFLAHTGSLRKQNSSKKSFFPMRRVMYAAAIVSLVLIISSLSYWQGSERVKTKFADMVVEAPLGSKTKMYLPDGTLVWLNAASRITYSQGFGVNDRSIHLVGEGYFEVTRNERLPFIVRTDELHVNVLGTKFNFNNYPDEQEASVALLEGKVQVTNIIKSNEKATLLPDQKVFLNKTTGEMRVSKANSSHSSEWTSGYLFFDEELLPDIIKELERSYNVKITLADRSLESYRFYGKFSRMEDTLEDILDMLSSTNKIQYKINGREILLNSK